MASYYLFYETDNDFYDELEQHNPTIVRKMIKCVLSAIKRKKKKIEVFEVTYRNSEVEYVVIYEKDYVKVLKTQLPYMIATDEDWILCATMRDAITKLEKPNKINPKENKENSII